MKVNGHNYHVNKPKKGYQRILYFVDPHGQYQRTDCDGQTHTNHQPCDCATTPYASGGQYRHGALEVVAT